MINIGDIVYIHDDGQVYSTYDEFISHYCPSQLNNWIDGTTPFNSEETLYTVIAIGEHLRFKDCIIHVIKRIHDGRVFLISESGLTIAFKNDVKPQFEIIKKYFEIKNDCKECIYSKKCIEYKNISGDSICGASSLLSSFILLDE